MWKKALEREEQLRDRRIWWVFRVGNRSWCWVGGTRCGAPREETCREGGWFYPRRRPPPRPCGWFPPWASRRGAIRWSRRRQSCKSPASVSFFRPGSLAPLQQPNSVMWVRRRNCREKEGVAVITGFWTIGEGRNWECGGSVVNNP